MSGSRGRRSCTKHVSYSEPVAKFEEEVESDEDSKELRYRASQTLTAYVAMQLECIARILHKPTALIVYFVLWVLILMQKLGSFTQSASANSVSGQ